MAKRKINPTKELIKIDKKTRLNPRQEMFCQYFVADEEMLGNGTFSYAEAYNIKRVGNWYRTCSSAAHRLLRNVKISQRINELLNVYLNDNLVDTELAYTIAQKSDLGSKVAAIREYNKLRRRGGEEEKPLQELHLHLHSDKITKIITQSEEQIKKELEGEIISEQ